MTCLAFMLQHFQSLLKACLDRGDGAATSSDDSIVEIVSDNNTTCTCDGDSGDYSNKS